jgi:hypothetical protein
MDFSLRNFRNSEREEEFFKATRVKIPRGQIRKSNK